MNLLHNDFWNDRGTSMKAIVYNIKPREKELLVIANNKKHDLTLISNELNVRTVSYAQGKEVVIVSSYDILDREMLWELKNAGVKKIVTRSKATTHIDLAEATRMEFTIANTPDEDQSPESIAQQIIRNLTFWESGKCVGKACCCQKICSMDAKKKVKEGMTVETNYHYRYGHGGK